MFVEQDVVRLEVPMHESFIVKETHPVANAEAQREEPLPCHAMFHAHDKESTQFERMETINSPRPWEHTQGTHTVVQVTHGPFSRDILRLFCYVHRQRSLLRIFSHQIPALLVWSKTYGGQMPLSSTKHTEEYGGLGQKNICTRTESARSPRSTPTQSTRD